MHTLSTTGKSSGKAYAGQCVYMLDGSSQKMAAVHVHVQNISEAVGTLTYGSTSLVSDEAMHEG